jgi:GntR family transcriptional regulator, arabinose operon transcriptional repressor
MISDIQVKTKREEVKETVRSLITQHRLRAGDQILSDNKLAKLCRVSPLTANRALVDMENEGILRRIKGKGTFIKKNPVNASTTRAALIQTRANLSNPAVNINCWHIVQRAHEALLMEIGGKGKVSTVIIEPDDISMDAICSLEDYDVIFFIGYEEYEKLICRIFEKTSLPIVVLSEETDTRNCLNIYTDKPGNTTRAVSHLAEHGYRRIGYIGMTPDPKNEKLTGYKTALEQWGLSMDEKRIVTGINSQQEGARGASILFNRGFDCDAVFVDTDLKAVDAIEYFRKVGIRVPEDLAIVSYDGLEPYLSGSPYLTSVNIDYRKMISTAFSKLRKVKFNRDKAIGKIVYHSKVKIGKTCGCDIRNIVKT